MGGPHIVDEGRKRRLVGTLRACLAVDALIGLTLPWFFDPYELLGVLGVFVAIEAAALRLALADRIDAAASVLTTTLSLATAWMVHTYGGFDAPVTTVYFVVIVLGAAAHRARGAVATSVGVIGLTSAQIAYEVSLGQPPDLVHLAVTFASLGIVSVMAITTVSLQEGALVRVEALAAAEGQARRELASARAAQAAILDSLPDPVLVTTSTGAVTYANDAAKAYVDPDRLNLPAASVPHGTRRFRTTLDTVVGPRPAQVAASVISIDGQPTWIWSLTDLTARQRAEAETARALQLAQEASTQKSRFLANMSHELRTPLNAILGYTEMLIDDADDRIRDDLGQIHRAGNHLLHLINDVLDLSRVEAGKMVLQPEDVDLDRLIRSAVDQVQPAARANGDRCTYRAESELGTWRIDGLRLSQVITNLLSNAVKFTRDGEVELCARTWHQAGSQLLAVKVHDTGIGMSEAQMQRLFKPFAQADDSTSRRFGGTGLGLVLCRHFAELMGGTILLGSREGQGTWVKVVVPLEAAAAASDRPCA